MSMALSQSDGASVFWKLYRQKLDTLNKRFNCVEAGDTFQPKDARIERLLSEYDESDGRSFELLYAAEQNLIEIASDDFVHTEIVRRLEEARQRSLAKVDPISTELQGEATAPQRREMLLTLVDELQLDYTREKLDSTARQKASERLNAFAIALVVITLIVIALNFVPAQAFYSWIHTDDELAEMGDKSLSSLTHFHLIFVMWFGVIGAYFSRLISFRFNAASMTRDGLSTEFSRSSIIMRLIIGFFSAIIMYLLIASSIASGTFFPEIENVVEERPAERRSVDISGGSASVTVTETYGAEELASAEGLAATQTDAEPIPVAVSENTSTSPNAGNQPSAVAPSSNWAGVHATISADLALLLIWSFLAGFSERLIPDRFTSLERQTTKTEG